MIGNTGDFEIEDYVEDTKKSRDVIDTFGTEYGLEDGWSEEMLNIGFGYSNPKRPMFSSTKQKMIAQARKNRMAQAHPLSGFDGQMGLSLADITKQITSTAQAEIDKAKAAAAAQLEAQKQKIVAQTKQNIQTQTTNLINKAASTIQSKLDQGVTAVAQSPVVQSAVTSGTSSLVDKAIAYKDELIKKSKPVLIIGGIAGGLLLAWYIYSKKKAR